MANYLPVLLVSVTAGMPDDASLQPLPRGQVDYLSHEWQEEDVWRSWRNMTKQKNEIANGVRLENASWRTWWKQRNKLKTISPETLNWLKDSDVTWLYGPLHTAVDWTPPPKSSTPSMSSVGLQSEIRKGITSPSSSVALDMYPAAHGYGYQSSFQGSGQGTGMKPILKHRSISEMLTSALPPSPLFGNIEGDGNMPDDDEDEDGYVGRVVFRYDAQGRPISRPPMTHTKSDTNILRRFGNKNSSPRIAAATAPHYSPVLRSTAESSENSLSTASGPMSTEVQRNARLTYSKRSSSSGNLVDLSSSSTFSSSGFSQYTNLKRPVDSPASTTPSAQSTTLNDVDHRQVRAGSQQSLSNCFNVGAGSGSNGLQRQDQSPPPSQQPQPQQSQKKHISFNAIVEQCIAIDGSPGPKMQTNRVGSHRERADSGEDSAAPDYDDGYDEDEEDGPGDDLRSSSDSEGVFDEDDGEGVLEIRTPSRRSSNSSSDGTFREPSVRSQSPYSPQFSSPSEPCSQVWASQQNPSPDEVEESRPSFRDLTTPRPGRGRGTGKFARTSRSKSGSTSASSSSRSRSTQTSDREHVTIAPIAPTILKAGGSTSSEDNALYVGYRSYGARGGRWRSGTAGDGRVYDAFDAVELGAEPTEYGLQHSIMSVYPWLNRDARIVDFDDPHFNNADLADDDDDDDDDDDKSITYRRSMDGSVTSRNSEETPNGRLRLRYGYDRLPPADAASPGQTDFSSEFAVHERSQLMRDMDNFDVGLTNGAFCTNDSPDSDDSPLLYNPRVSSLRAETSNRPATVHSVDTEQPTLVYPAPTLAIPTPGISSAHFREQDPSCSSASPTQTPGHLSPHDVSPSRGRSPCPSPVSGYLTTGSTTSSSGLFSIDSRSVSESRSDSRGRSRTRGSSVSASDQEPERGRSRSRSNTTSGANSPLSDSNSPSSRRASTAADIGGHGHSGREIRDGRGVGLYRKTSEDNLKRPSARGRDRDHRRISESLSPPVIDSRHDDLRCSPPELYHGPGNLSHDSPSHPPYAEHRSFPSSDFPANAYVHATVSRVIPPSIPEEDEHRACSGLNSPNEFGGMVHDGRGLGRKGNEASNANAEPGLRPTVARHLSSGVVIIGADAPGDGLPSSLVGKAAGIVSSARGLFGSIWSTAT